MTKSASLLSVTSLWQPASSIRQVKAEPKFPPLSLPALKGLFQSGLQRGAIAEISGRRSSGKTSACLHILAQATRRGEVCAVVDASGNFHPESATEAGVELSRLVWIRCKGNSGHALRAADLLLHAGSFSVVWLDLCEVPVRVLNQIPISYWYRFQRAVENTPTTLLVCADLSQARSSVSNNLELKPKAVHWSGARPSVLLRGIEATGICQKTARVNSSLVFETAV